MSVERPTLVDPPIENLLKKVGDSKFTLVSVAAIRAREINEYLSLIHILASGSHMLNSVGLAGPGVEAWREHDLPRLAARCV